MKKLLLHAAASLFVVALLLGVAVDASVCPDRENIQRGWKYHDDSQCDRTAYNAFKASLGRHVTHQKYKQMGGISTVPNAKTVTCPAAGARVTLKDPRALNTGLDTVWFVENRASTPVVVSYLTPEGVEVSAKNPEIAPAVSDPNAVLQPGDWMAVYSFEGHEFVVRQVLKGGVGVAAGNVLLQHRPGLIPVGAAALDLRCPDNATDIEPIVNETTAPAFARTPPTVRRPCHTMDIGFRNAAPCPLHGYYVEPGEEGSSCREEFKLHLGVQSVVPDFMNDWVSQTKYEGTFIGHTYHFRLASNPAILVDTVTLAPVIVTDCPNDSATAAAVPVDAAGTQAFIGGAEFFSNATDHDDVYASYSSASRLYYYSNATTTDAYQPYHSTNVSAFAKPPAAGSI